MKNSKLITLLKTFDSKELRAFKDFVESPYFNKQKDLRRFYDYLKKWAVKGFPENRIERNTVFDYLYPGQPYHEKNLNHLMSQLFKLAEHFIGLRKLEQEGVLLEYQILSSYVDRQLDKPYRHILNHTKNQLAKLPFRDENYFLQQLLVSDLVEKHFSSKKIRQVDQSLQQAADDLDVFYLVKKLKYLCAMLDQQKLLHADYKLRLVEEVKSAIQKGEYLNIPGIAIYYTLFLTLTEQEADSHFYSLKELLLQHGHLFSHAEIRDLYYFAINYCIQKIRLGDKNFTTELMGLYQEGIEKAYLLDKSQISPWTFKNMVKLGLGLNRFTWVEHFVKEYNHRLPEEMRADAFHFNLADLHYHKKEYDLAMHHLGQVEFTDVHYNLDSKVMLLKIYFENAEEEAFISLVNSLKLYLKRNKLIPKNVKAPYLNFLSILNEIYRYAHSRKEKIKQRIASTAMLNDRSWLLQQLES